MSISQHQSIRRTRLSVQSKIVKFSRTNNTVSQLCLRHSIILNLYGSYSISSDIRRNNSRPRSIRTIRLQHRTRSTQSNTSNSRASTHRQQIATSSHRRSKQVRLISLISCKHRIDRRTRSMCRSSRIILRTNQSQSRTRNRCRTLLLRRSTWINNHKERHSRSRRPTSSCRQSHRSIRNGQRISRRCLCCRTFILSSSYCCHKSPALYHTTLLIS